MFILVRPLRCWRYSVLTNVKTTIEDLIQIAPQDFSKESAQAIKDAINIKYANKVIHKVGLCITMWDMLKTSEGLIGHGTGLVNVNGKIIRFNRVVGAVQLTGIHS
jgi:DNA-directed RNA polymerase subunit E'/Rpb7